MAGSSMTVEAKLKQMLFKENFDYRTERIAILSKQELDRGREDKQKGFVTISTTLEQMAKYGSEGFSIYFSKDKELEKLVSYVLKISSLVRTLKFVEEEVLTALQLLVVFSDRLSETNPSLFKRIFDGTQGLNFRGTHFTNEVGRIYNGDSIKDNKTIDYAVSPHTRVKDYKVTGSPALMRRLDNEYMLSIHKRILKALWAKTFEENKEYLYITVKECPDSPPQGITEEEEASMLYNETIGRYEVDYAYLVRKRYLLKYIPLEELGILVRRWEDENLLTNFVEAKDCYYSQETNSIVYKNQLVGEFVVRDDGVIIKALHLLNLNCITLNMMVASDKVHRYIEENLCV